MEKILRVLLIDRLKRDSLSIIRVLKEAGFAPRYEQVKTEQAARDALRDKPWDVILFGCNLPHFDFSQAITLVRDLNVDVPLIIVSDAVGEEATADFMRSGARDFVRKDHLPHLIPAIERELGKTKSRIERRRDGHERFGSEFRLKALFENTNFGAVICETLNGGADFTFMYLNRFAEKNEKIDRRELVGKSLLTAYPGIREMGLLDVLQRVWRSGQPEQMPVAHYQDDRIQSWRENYVYKLPNGEVVILYHDITERMETQNKLSASEEKYRLLVENSKDVIFIVQQGAVKFINQAALDLLDSSYDRLTSTPFAQFIHPDDREMVLSNHLRRINGEEVPPQYVFRVVTPAGKLKWVEIRSTLVSWEGSPATLNFLSDVTDRKRAETALRESEGKFRFLAERMTDIVWTAGMDLHTSYVTPSVQKILGFTQEERMRQSITEQLTPDSLSLALNTLAREQANEERRDADPARTLNLELEFYHKDGTTRWLDVVITGIRNEQGALTGIHGAARDITERIKVEAKLKESEERFSSLFDHSKDYVYVLDLNGTFIDANFSALNALEYDWSEISSLSITSVLHESDMAKGMENFAEIVRTGFQKHASDYILKSKSGRMIHVETQASLVYRDGRPHSVLGIARDTTVRRRSEEALRESERKHRELVDSLPIALFETNLQGNIVSANPAIFELFGYQQSDLKKGLNPVQMIMPDELERFGTNFQRLLSGEKKGTSEYRGLRKDGSTFPFLVFPSVVIHEGKPVGVRGAIIDLTERQRAQEELQKSEEKYRSILAGIEEGYFEVDLAGCFTFFNDSLCRMYGYPKEEISGLHYSRYTDEANGKRLFTIFNTMYSTGNPSAAYSYDVIKKDGVRRVMEASATLIRDGRGNISGFRGVVRDVTERKEMEERVRQSEERYRTIIEQMTDGYFEVDLKGCFTFANDSHLAIVGSTRDRLIGMHVRQYVSSEKQKELRGLFRNLFVTGIPVKAYDLEYIKRDGTIAYLSMSIALIRNAAGEPVGFRGVARDITERRAMEEKIRQSEERYRTIIEQMTDGYYEIDLSGHFTFANDALCANSGYTRDELIGMQTRQYVVAEKVKEVYGLFQEMLATGIPIDAYDVEHVKKDKTISYNSVSASLMRDTEGKPIGFRGISRDVTERKTAEIKLKDYAEEIRDLYNNAPCGYHSLGPDASFIRINNTELSWLGYDRDEIIGKKKWTDLLTAESREKFHEIFPAFKGQGWANDLAFDVVRKDGSIFTVLLNAMAVKDQDGRFSQSRATLFDVTQLKKVQEELNEKNLELVRMYEDLRTKQAMILQQEKMASIGMLAAGVAHEIKNPLAIILQGIDYLQTAAGMDSLTSDILKRLNSAVRRADRIVKDLLSYARQKPVALVEQDIRTLLDESLTLTEHEFHAKNITLIKDYAADLPMVAVDGNQMKQVFINLILNSIEAMPKKGKFTIDVQTIKEDAEKRFIQLTFKDTGPGIPEDIIKRIFDPFFTTKAIGNTGLGLSISKGIIDMHGGIIYAENQKAEGASMIIKLPLPS